MPDSSAINAASYTTRWDTILSRSALAEAMNELFRKKIIRSLETGPDSKRRHRIVRA
jgi:hypothetical protein